MRPVNQGVVGKNLSVNRKTDVIANAQKDPAAALARAKPLLPFLDPSFQLALGPKQQPPGQPSSEANVTYQGRRAIKQTFHDGTEDAFTLYLDRTSKKPFLLITSEGVAIKEERTFEHNMARPRYLLITRTVEKSPKDWKGFTQIQGKTELNPETEQLLSSREQKQLVGISIQISRDVSFSTSATRDRLTNGLTHTGGNHWDALLGPSTITPRR